ncbi:MAG: glycosyltransferase [Acidobacteria bacterium]|nr:glycosyltransferase [Acidobacteriota bacterium]MCA1643037.1 glycosyltransferase [Acidobacteriota bacterium]
MDEIKISVVVPVRDEEDSIRVLLDGLLAQTRRADEIVITDGGSRDRTAEIVGEYARRGEPVSLMREGAALPGRGRNLAAARASSDWLAFIDAGTRPAAVWLEALAEAVERDPTVDAVFGSWEPITDSFFKECAAIAYAYAPPVEFDGVSITPPCVGSSLVRRKVWQEVGGFAEELRSGEDILFMEKISGGNFRVAYAPRALVSWEMQPTLWRTFKRFTLYSRHNLRAGLWRQWHAAVVGRYAALLLCALPSLALGARWLAAVAGLWLLMQTARAVVALRRNRRSFPATPARNAARLLLLVPVISTLDAATILGAIHWAVADRLRVSRAAAIARD